MTELERARAHLSFCQNSLFSYRRWSGNLGGSINGNPAVLQGYEQHVVAALAWVWQEQEREKAGKLINDYGIPWIREALGDFP